MLYSSSIREGYQTSSRNQNQWGLITANPWSCSLSWEVPLTGRTAETASDWVQEDQETKKKLVMKRASLN